MPKRVVFCHAKFVTRVTQKSVDNSIFIQPANKNELIRLDSSSMQC